MLFDKEKVLRFLPHRDPFLFIDSVSEVHFDGLDKGKSPTRENLLGNEVIAHFHVRNDLPLFAGHFPDNPILPGVIQVEMMAQASGFAVPVIYPNILGKNAEMALLGISSAKFRRPVLPGMDLVIKTKCTKMRGPVMSYIGQIYSDGLLMSEVEFLASIKV